MTSPPTPLRVGEGSKKLNFSLLLPFRFGEGGWEGEVCRGASQMCKFIFIRDFGLEQ
ncbi:hypothetical protein COO91_04304 [Nostoc flagelliforme CCNUN1]|uniref:Uncharacterized protein n=1 Tax=Nostoc flagelliforme CCNUN1 TaxID=2038116 RepID=A0A2K8SSD4_9NOSO|nr:hypothetical protein COO91_04304 [Nostoc flagelliforme CCNUN1]